MASSLPNPSDGSTDSALNELSKHLHPAVVESPPIQSPPVQTSDSQDTVQRLTFLGLAQIRPLCWLVAIAALSMSGPAIWFVVLNLYHNASGSVLPVWACCLFLVTLILLGFASLMRIVPNRITLYATGWAMLSCVVISALLLGALLVAGPTNAMVGGLQLDTDVVFPLRISLGASVAWAFVMLNISTLVTYIVGRVAVRSV